MPAFSDAVLHQNMENLIWIRLEHYRMGAHGKWKVREGEE